MSFVRSPRAEHGTGAGAAHLNQLTTQRTLTEKRSIAHLPPRIIVKDLCPGSKLIMFGLASGFYQSYLIPPEVSILIVGLDDSGKSTLLERVKVIDFKSKESVGKRIAVQQIPNDYLHTEKSIDRKDNVSPVQPRKSPSKEHALEMKPNPKRRLFSCPAPKMYQQSRVDSDEETELIESKDDSEDAINSPTNGNIDVHDGIIDLPCNNVAMSPANSPGRSQPDQSGDLSDDGFQDEIQSPPRRALNHNFAFGESDNRELDLKAGKKMFPLHLIRPTSEFQPPLVFNHHAVLTLYSIMFHIILIG